MTRTPAWSVTQAPVVLLLDRTGRIPLNVRFIYFFVLTKSVGSSTTPAAVMHSDYTNKRHLATVLLLLLFAPPSAPADFTQPACGRPRTSLPLRFLFFSLSAH